MEGFWSKRRLIRVCVMDSDNVREEFRNEDFPFNWGM